MRGKIWLLLVLMSLAALPGGAETIHLEDPAAIRYAIAVDEGVDRLSAKVMACIEANDGRTEGCICLDACTCPFAEEFSSAKAAYEEAIEAYPSWRGEIVFYRLAGDPMGYNLNFEGLERQFGGECRP